MNNIAIKFYFVALSVAITCNSLELQCSNNNPKEKPVICFAISRLDKEKTKSKIQLITKKADDGNQNQLLNQSDINNFTKITRIETTDNETDIIYFYTDLEALKGLNGTLEQIDVGTLSMDEDGSHKLTKPVFYDNVFENEQYQKSINAMVSKIKYEEFESNFISKLSIQTLATEHLDEISCFVKTTNKLYLLTINTGTKEQPILSAPKLSDLAAITEKIGNGYFRKTIGNKKNYYSYWVTKNANVENPTNKTSFKL